jgi:tRNA U34 5-methylaminomethyl-2-thiouridine-forming methyltransferase MnmC
MQPKLIITADGSHSLRIEEIGETYHSVHGAIQESKHVFIKSGLNSLAKKSEFNILEIGLGTALNAFLTFMETPQTKVNYIAIEPFPLAENIVERLNYPELLNATDCKEKFSLFHTCEWEKEQLFSETFVFKKINNKIQNANLNNWADLVYFDAFGPRVQPEMWTDEVFSKLYKAMKSNAILVTYCAKGEVKRTLKSVGFRIETLPGPPGKREMIRAIKE